VLLNVAHLFELEDGALAHEQLDLFQDRLDGIFGRRARFMVLSGEEEVPYFK
jgi:hypothetical protein